MGSSTTRESWLQQVPPAGSPRGLDPPRRTPKRGTFETTRGSRRGEPRATSGSRSAVERQRCSTSRRSGESLRRWSGPNRRLSSTGAASEVSQRGSGASQLRSGVGGTQESGVRSDSRAAGPGAGVLSLGGPRCLSWRSEESSPVDRRRSGRGLSHRASTRRRSTPRRRTRLPSDRHLSGSERPFLRRPVPHAPGRPLRAVSSGWRATSSSS